MNIPKPARQVDEDYLNRVRRLPCSVPTCRGVYAEPHHLMSRGAGGSDYTSIPLCRQHHSEIHTIGRHRFQTEHGIDLWAVNARVLASYLVDLSKQLKSENGRTEYLSAYVRAVETMVEKEEQIGREFVSELCEEIKKEQNR